MFAGRSLEAQMGFDDEAHAIPSESFRECVPLLGLQDDSAMGHRHAVAVDGVEVRTDTAILAEIRVEVTDELMTEHVEVDPCGVAAAFGAADDVAIEAARFGDVPDLNRDVKWSRRHDRFALLLGAVVLLASCAEMGQVRTTVSDPPCIETRHGCIALNPDVTEGDRMATICVAGYTAAVRPSSRYTNGVKRELMREAGIDASRIGDYELDHIVPLALGGHPTKLSNLALQPWRGENSATEKDVLEHRLQRMVCAGRIPLAAAQYCIAEDWHACEADIAAGRTLPAGRVQGRRGSSNTVPDGLR